MALHLDGSTRLGINRFVGETDLPPPPRPAGPPPPPAPGVGESDDVEGRTRPPGAPPAGPGGRPAGATGAGGVAGAGGATGPGGAAGATGAGKVASGAGRAEPAPPSPSFWSRVGGFFGNLLGVATDPVRSIVFGVVNIIGDVAHGRFGSALERLVHLPFDLVLIPLARLYLAGAALIKGGGEALDGHQKELLKKRFGPTVDVDAIRVVPNGPWPFINSKNDAITIGNTIYIDRPLSELTDDLLVHEATHVMQYQSGGPDYATRAFWHGQLTDEKYNFALAFANGKTHWEDLNLEQQAELMQTIQRSGFDPGVRGRDRFYVSLSDEDLVSTAKPTYAENPDAIDLTPLATEALRKARHGGDGGAR